MNKEIKLKKVEIASPRSQRDLNMLDLSSAIYVVKISIHGHEKRRNIWAVYEGIERENNIFITQEKSEHRLSEDPFLVAKYKSPVNTHMYDKNLGILLNPNLYQMEFLGPKKNEYNSHVNILKLADVWREQ